jgi:hypothetical protein
LLNDDEGANYTADPPLAKADRAAVSAHQSTEDPNDQAAMVASGWRVSALVFFVDSP